MLLAFVAPLGFSVPVAADPNQSSSTHYSVNEVQFGAGSSDNTCSGNYCAQASVGDTGVGTACSANYCAQGGFMISTSPLLEVSVANETQNMGTITPTTTGSATMLVKVRSYLSSGYTLEIIGLTPSQGTHHLTALTSPSTSQPGTEQFGVNLVANTMPSVGAAPLQVPSGSFSFGYVKDSYKNADQFMYQSGDDVAESDSSTGETDYTVSMVANVSNVTPGGYYVGAFQAEVVPVF